MSSVSAGSNSAPLSAPPIIASSFFMVFVYRCRSRYQSMKTRGMRWESRLAPWPIWRMMSLLAFSLGGSFGTSQRTKPKRIARMKGGVFIPGAIAGQAICTMRRNRPGLAAAARSARKPPNDDATTCAWSRPRASSTSVAKRSAHASTSPRTT